MVISGSGAPTRRSDPVPPMARSSSQSSIHDFSSFPVLKTWGSHKLLRCVKLQSGNGDGGGASGPSDERSAAPERGPPRPSPPPPPRDDELEKVRTKLKVDRHGSTDKIGHAVAPPRDGAGQDDPVTTATPTASTAGPPDPAPAAEMPWSLRTRRGAYVRQPWKGNESGPLDLPPLPPQPRPPRLLRLRSGGSEEDGARRRKFSVVLSKEEIEEDVYALTGKRASRRPKKRPRALRRQLDLLFPGYYLDEVAPESYDVPELPPPPPES